MSLFMRSRKAKKSKSMDDLSSRQVSTLTQSQKVLLVSALMKVKEKASSPAASGHESGMGNKMPHIRSESNLVNMASTCGRSPSESVSAGRVIRKSYSCGETMKLKEHQNVQLDVLPKKKYTKRFEKIFRSVVGEETLYNCYSCALYQDSIATGHLYLTFGWFCFYSNFMGRQRQISIDVSRIESITQQRTAKIIPNAIKITTDNTSYLFSSFISRDRAYRTLITVWRNCREAHAKLSSDDSDLSDVESMTRIATFSGYADEQSARDISPFEDSMSERSIPCAELDVCAKEESTSTEVLGHAAPLDDPHAEGVVDSASPTVISPESITTDPGCPNRASWKPWATVVRILQSMMGWCDLPGPALSDGGGAIYSTLLICTALLVVTSLYLCLRIFIFEREQMNYMLERHSHQNALHTHYRVDTTLDLNHQLLLQMTHVLSSIHKLIANSSFGLCT